MNYGTQILVMRAVNRITQKELAGKANIRLDRMIDFERNQALPTFEQKERIAKALDWPSDALEDVAFDILEGYFSLDALTIWLDDAHEIVKRREQEALLEDKEVTA